MGAYFSYEDLMELKALEQKKLAQVIYHNWQNKSQPDDVFEFLDRLELIFSDETKIILAANEEENQPGIFVVRDFDAEKTRLLLLHQFGGRIDYYSREMTHNALWTPVMEKTLELVGLVDDGENCFRDDAILLDFGDEKLEIHPAIEGLMIEPYEEV